MRDELVCPVCRGDLEWGSRDARCHGCGSDYPTESAVPVLLPPDERPDDSWREATSGLEWALRADADLERRLMGVPAGELAPADRVFRALVLEERGDFTGAAELAAATEPEVYTAEYRRCRDAQTAEVLDFLADEPGPIVDIASGRCFLVERLARRLAAELVATDVSPTVLARSRRRLATFGLDERVSFLCFDARRTPFRSGSIATLTTNLGLANVPRTDALLAELRRICSGRLVAVTHFFPADDRANFDAIHALGLERILLRAPALEAFRTAGWRVEVVSERYGRAEPTPYGVVLEGASVDGLPIAPTELDWVVLEATPS